MIIENVLENRIKLKNLCEFIDIKTLKLFKFIIQYSLNELNFVVQIAMTPWLLVTLIVPNILLRMFNEFRFWERV